MYVVNLITVLLHVIVCICVCCVLLIKEAIISKCIRDTSEDFGVDHAFKVFDMLVKHTTPDIFVLNALIGACRRANQPQRALKLWPLLYTYRLRPDKVDYICCAVVA